MDTDGSEVTTVSSDTGNVTGPTWNPDGSQILYVTTGEAHEGHDYAGARFRIVDLPGLEARSLDLPPDVLGARAPAWSPDGTRFAVQQMVEENFEICVLNADGSELVNVSDHPSLDADPAWSPDGTEIVFVSDRDGDLEIYRMTADGSSVIQLTANEGKDVEPAWSSDGKICPYRTAAPSRKRRRRRYLETSAN